ncbi:MAG: ChaN family lipoprotein [Deltaproteobacteria bacterium]|nr:ChaN family lipoprotein [Deltaproteobacteria bacterium]
MKHAYELELLTTANRLSSVFRLAATTALAATVLASAACAHPHADQDQADCGVVGTWIDPATAETIAPNQLLAGLAQRPVVLLGESHDNAEHHRWQLHTLAALHGHNPDMILGFESFPRRSAPRPAGPRPVGERRTRPHRVPRSSGLGECLEFRSDPLLAVV